ncbi:Fur family transcriptional regulator [Streptomonospora wellingtoniae]|uniref:Fur family transcriptional regulator n=1 Tax=Streptomonospora wellingtoniae TaxID=3075544 RepID=A0ABU2L0A7_9ACTN|nr:Fur family transcriptional regulator [Streptomonospora sp. DSM 45055]MDT0304768.1 Fur family transcriptional regulator [Streptomonospora sp. DSM 45055]
MDNVADDLRSAGLRVTAARVAILDHVRSGNHLDAERIARGVRGSLGHVSTQAVYDALHALTKAGLLRRIEPAGSPARFESRVGDNHHHLVCRSCGEVADIDCVVGEAPCVEPSETHGYAVDEAEVVFWGVCPQCQAQAAGSGGGEPAQTESGG